jgi:hypothetical protein
MEWLKVKPLSSSPRTAKKENQNQKQKQKNPPNPNWLDIIEYKGSMHASALDLIMCG